MARAQENGSDGGGKSPLDEGIAINGEIQVQLFNLKLLPVKVRLLITSMESAKQLGLDWWREEGRGGSQKSSGAGAQEPGKVQKSIASKGGAGGKGNGRSGSGRGR